MRRNNCGDDTIQHSFDVVFTPQAGFIIDTTSGCGSATVFVDDTSSGFNATRSWDFGDGTNSTADTVNALLQHSWHILLGFIHNQPLRNGYRTRYHKQYTTTPLLASMTLLEAVRPTPLTQLIYLPLILFLHCIIGILETEGTSTNASPGAITYLTPGTYSLKLRVTDLCGGGFA